MDPIGVHNGLNELNAGALAACRLAFYNAIFGGSPVEIPVNLFPLNI
jgi:hypothetical protein